MSKANQITNRKQFEKAVDEYTAQGHSPKEIQALLERRGCICATVAVEIYLRDKAKASS